MWTGILARRPALPRFGADAQFLCGPVSGLHLRKAQERQTRPGAQPLARNSLSEQAKWLWHGSRLKAGQVRSFKRARG